MAKGGTDIMHFFDRASFESTGIASGASGSVSTHQNRQGHADNQWVLISLKGLEANAAYELQVSTVGDTNSKSVYEFTTDARGHTDLNFRQQGNGKGRGHHKLPLGAMDPVSELRSFSVVDTNAQTVLKAELTNPSHLQYLIKRNLSGNEATGTLRIKATGDTARLRLNVGGLSATNDYYLVLNGGIVQTNSTDAHGRLKAEAALSSTLDILDLRSVAVWDSGSNAVLNTTLP